MKDKQINEAKKLAVRRIKEGCSPETALTVFEGELNRIHGRSKRYRMI